MAVDRAPWAGLGSGSMEMLARAYVMAIRRRSTVVGTADLLAQMAALGRQVRWRELDRQREALSRIAFGLASPPRQDVPGELAAAPVPAADLDAAEVRAALREAEWRARRRAGAHRFESLTAADVHEWGRRPQWTPALSTVLIGALAAARGQGRSFAGSAHLALAMLQLEECAGTRYLVPGDRERRGALGVLGRSLPGLEPVPPVPELDEIMAVLSPETRAGTVERVLGRVLAKLSRVARLSLPIAVAQGDVKRQAARLGHGVAGPAHALLATLAVETAWRSVEKPASPPRDQGAGLLLAAGTDPVRLARLVESRSAPPPPSAEVLGAQAVEMRLGDPLLGDEVCAAGERAAEISRLFRHADTGTSHYLLALLETREGPEVMRELGIDVAGLRAEVRASLEAVPPAWE